MFDIATDPTAPALGHLSPAWPILAAGVLCAVAPSHAVRKALMIAAPLVAFALWANAELGIYGQVTLAGFTLETFRFDPLSRIFGLIFIIATLINGVFAFHERAQLSDSSALLYAGSGLGAVFAGDLITLFVFWELMAVSSVFLIWARGTESAVSAGMRYLAIQVASGVLLLAGAVVVYTETGSLAFERFDPETLGGFLILLAFGIKAAFPFLHNWLQDSYPRATATGAVVLSAFTTKLAIYALARSFAGYEPLIYIGAIMTVFPVFFAVIENDLRRVLAYSLNNQLGFMVCGVGIGSQLALNGAAAHAFCHILYKALLFMSMGAVLHRVGTCKASDLGGLFKSMPFTAIFCIIGAASISAFPLFSGFVSKSLILSAAAKEELWLVWIMLLFASAGVLEHSGIKIPFFAFFAHDSGRRPKEAPFNMLLAMGVAAFMCVYIGVNPGWLYAMLPYEMSYEPYTLGHIITQMQLLMAAMFAFAALMRFGFYPHEQRAVILDFDWVYRRLGFDLIRWGDAICARLAFHGRAALGALGREIDKRLHAVFSPAGALTRVLPDGFLALWTALILGVALVVAFVAPA